MSGTYARIQGSVTRRTRETRETQSHMQFCSAAVDCTYMGRSAHELGCSDRSIEWPARKDLAALFASAGIRGGADHEG